jgi:hypothetical protein
MKFKDISEKEWKSLSDHNRTNIHLYMNDIYSSDRADSIFIVLIILFGTEFFPVNILLGLLFAFFLKYLSNKRVKKVLSKYFNFKVEAKKK